MRPPSFILLALGVIVACQATSDGQSAQAQPNPTAGGPASDPSGAVQLRLLDSTLDGRETAIALNDPTAWVNPTSSGQPASKFYYVSGTTISQTAPSGYGTHASTVSASMVGIGTGGNPITWQNSMAPGIGDFYSYNQ